MSSPPLIMTGVTPEEAQRGDGELVGTFIEGYCRVTKDGYGARAGELLRLRPWQRTLIAAVYARRADGRRKHRQALIGLPRKNGKSAIGSSMGLHALIMSGEGAEVYSCASDKDQARIVFGVAKRMVEMEPQLSAMIKPYRDVLEVPATGSIYKALSSEAFSKEGLNPNAVIYDEVHAAPTDELYNVMSLASDARIDPILIAITTAGVKADQTGGDSICYRLWQYGKRIAAGEADDPSFFMAWWGAPMQARADDPEAWKIANPGYGDLLDPDGFSAAYRRAAGNGTVNDYRTKRMNQWVNQAQAWLPEGAWAKCERPRPFEQPGKGVVLGFDGSKSGDCTALVAVTVETDPKIKVVGLWEKPQGRDGDDWKVPRGEVKDAIREACRVYTVREIAWDEWMWLDAAEELEDEGLPVVIFPQTLTRMGPATQRFHEMVANERISHDGDPRLARHLDNAWLKVDSRGSRLQKDARNSPRKIDLAVAAVMAVDRAGYWLTQPSEGMYTWEDAAGMKHSKPVSEIGFVW